MGKKAIKKIILGLFAGFATFGVLANDLLPVSAPILAVGRSGQKQQAELQPPVAVNEVSHFDKPSEVPTSDQVVATVNPADSPAASVLPEQVPVAAESQKPIAFTQELEIKSEIDKSVQETGKQIPYQAVLFTSDWLDLSSPMVEKVSFSSGKTKIYSRERLAPPSEVGVLTAAGSEPVFQSRAPSFPALKAARPSLFGTIVNRKVPSQPDRPVLSSFQWFSEETVSATKAEAQVVSLVPVKNESKSQPIFAIMAPRTSSPILEGTSTIDLRVSPRLATEPRQVPVRVMPSVASSPILEGPHGIDLGVFPRLAMEPRQMPVKVMPWVASSPILEGPSAIDLKVFPRLTAEPRPIAVGIMPLFPSVHILEGPSAIDLTIFPRLATNSLSVVPVVVPNSIVANDARTAAAATALRPVTVLIGGQTAFSQAMLRPLGTAAPQSSGSVADMFVASNRGPSADSFSNDLSMRRSELENAKLPTAPSPVLITGQIGFSTEMLKPFNPKPIHAKPFNASTSSALPISGTPKQMAGYCDPTFIGEPIRFSQTVELKLEDLLNQLNARFGINFIIGQNVGKIPLNVKAGSIPWNILLKSQLFVSGVRARCINSTTIELVLNRDLPSLQDEGAVTTKFVKLKYFQRTSGGTVDLANRSQGGQNGGQGGCGGGGSQSGGISNGGSSGGGGGQSGQTAGQLGNNRFDKLILEIEKILGIRPMVGGGSSVGASNSETEEIRTNRFVTQVPGRNILVIRASDEEHELIDQIIARADRPPFQVVIKALVYSANQDLLRDIGVQSSIRGGNGSSRTSGGVLGDTLGVGTLFDFSTIIGTFDFNVQMTALQQNGVISVKSRPFSTVLDGLCTTLSVGTKLPIVIDSTLGGEGGIAILNADNLLQITP
ncbi:MAG TPA: hypothetical protein VJ781_02010, partial [Pyrinomonadaceae bacterium]|nr:hypothetical protein [Pyrinomonadaceae bacterium]